MNQFRQLSCSLPCSTLCREFKIGITEPEESMSPILVYSLMFLFVGKKQLHPWSLTTRPAKKMVGRRSSPFGKPTFHFQGWAVKPLGGFFLWARSSKLPSPSTQIFTHFLVSWKPSSQSPQHLWDSLTHFPDARPPQPTRASLYKQEKHLHKENGGGPLGMEGP